MIDLYFIILIHTTMANKEFEFEFEFFQLLICESILLL